MLTAVKQWLRRWERPFTQAPVRRSGTGHHHLRPISCIVVDGDPEARATISRTAKSLGAVTAEFDSVDDLLNCLDDCSPELIFLDVLLRGSDAIEAIRGLSARNFTGAVQLVSGHGEQLLMEIITIGKRHKLQMLPPIGKPCCSQTLRELARAHLRPAAGGKGDPSEIRESVDLDLALRKNWVEVWYQPKIDLRQKSLVGLEALARIRHPQLGITPASNFLRNAKAQSIHRLTEHVITTSLRDWSRMRDAGFIVKLAVNVSADCLTKVPIAKLVREHRPNDSNWPGLMLEITEEQVIRDLDAIQEIATQMKLYGVSFSIDDFGSGYSSFQRLKQFVFSELKLDGSFVQGCAKDMKNASICKAIIDLAHSFGAQAVAECVEDRDDLIALHGMNCDIVQGHLLCHPLPLSELTTTLKQKAVRQRSLAPNQDVPSRPLQTARLDRQTAPEPLV